MSSEPLDNDAKSFYLSLPVKLIRQVVELAVLMNKRTHNDQVNGQSNVYSLSLVSKALNSWVRPLLYHTVYLDSDEQAL